MNQPKVLVLDIETAPIVAYVWGTRDQNISLNHIQKDWYIIAWSAKWLGDKPSKIMYYDQRGAHPPEDDSIILKPLWNLLDMADIVITQNGQSFDGPKINARFIMHGWQPPSPYKHLDTYRIVRRVAKFTSNKLEYLTDKLCTKYKKLKHREFPGMSLWTECLAGNSKAWNAMKRYNIHDVLSTEEFYTKIQAWAPSSMPKPHTATNERMCETCSKYKVVKNGFHRSKKGLYQRLHCFSCGTWSIGGKVA